MSDRSGTEGAERDWAKIMGAVFVTLIGLAGSLVTIGMAMPFPFLRAHWLVLALSVGFVVTAITLFIVVVRRPRGSRPAGVVAAYSRREQVDREEILERMRTAKAIEMVGLNLRTPWFRQGSPFDELVRVRLQRERDFRLRVVIADPRSEGLRTRERREDGRQSGRLVSATEGVLGYLDGLLQAQHETQVEVRLADGQALHFSMVLVGDRGYVTFYRSGRTGDGSPALVLEERGGSLLGVFRQEFEDLWNEATRYPPPA